ncbi:hypothetical protein [Lentiprolixibacter aurantiacus]|uniref:Lipocalin-like domain-containing protein n=1 Tax=Lentiprolixibacter aurantiacus TaxID=2993939 RepID=A0AAE3MNS0_9FLAO|nr:hypothetical protein [Lentiprolixibacter aurantiacus]MCX2720593.1 hypothetical protein [Lentiprolixibacter aurantiacus]
MKKLFHFGVLLLALLVFVPAAGRNDIPDTAENDIPIISKKKWVGIWDYTVSDVPPEYTNGQIHVTKSGRDYLVELVMEYGKLSGKSVMLKSKVLYFEVDLDGAPIKITINREDDSISGEASTPDGVFFLEGQRRE